MKKDLDYLYNNNIIEWYNTLQSRKNNRMYRLYQNITYWYFYTEYRYFVTFTINNENLEKEFQFERKLKKILNDLALDKYMFNPDLSPQKGRLHFHAMIFNSKEITTESLKAWKYGFIQIKPITIFNKKALGKYITKLSLHALKGTTPKIYYSRKKKEV